MFYVLENDLNDLKDFVYTLSADLLRVFEHLKSSASSKRIQIK